MDATCLINNYNYRQHVGEAVRSALDQTRPFAKVVVVDDGSTDGSQEYLQQEFGDDCRVELLFKANGGQMSCFNVGVERAETDLVFFLDADDRYQPNYLEFALGVYAARPEVDFLSVAPAPFGEGDAHLDRRILPTGNLGLSVCAAALGGHWIGERTSCLSMKTAIAKSFLPFPYERDWVTRADDILVFGSSIAGACKRHEEQPLVDYRIHEGNHFAGRKFDALYTARRAVALNRTTRCLTERVGLDRAALPWVMHREFRTNPRPNYRDWRGYMKLAMRCKTPWRLKLKQVVAMTSHYLNPSKYGGSVDRVEVSTQVNQQGSTAERSPLAMPTHASAA
ncbi:MAG: glycosyltransferase family A protein [Planctomycetota bacterium]